MLRGVWPARPVQRIAAHNISKKYFHVLLAGICLVGGFDSGAHGLISFRLFAERLSADPLATSKKLWILGVTNASLAADDGVCPQE